MHRRPSVPGHVARDDQETLGLSVGIENGRNRHFPPFGFVAQRSEETDKRPHPTRRRLLDRRLRRLAVATLPESDP